MASCVEVWNTQRNHLQWSDINCACWEARRFKSVHRKSYPDTNKGLSKRVGALTFIARNHGMCGLIRASTLQLWHLPAVTIPQIPCVPSCVRLSHRVNPCKMGPHRLGRPASPKTSGCSPETSASSLYKMILGHTAGQTPANHPCKHGKSGRKAHQIPPTYSVDLPNV